MLLVRQCQLLGGVNTLMPAQLDRRNNIPYINCRDDSPVGQWGKFGNLSMVSHGGDHAICTPAIMHGELKINGSLGA